MAWHVLHAKARSFVEASSGTALLEFAFVLPIALFLYLGGYQLSEAIACNRKVTIATRAVADLVSRESDGNNTPIAASDIDSILNAGAAVLTPFPAARGSFRVSEVTTDDKGNATVTWSRGLHWTPRLKGDSFALSSDIDLPNTVYLFSETKYAYVPAVTFGFIGPIDLNQTVLMLPRNSDSIPCSDCS